jgi:hypothetical protein
MINPLVMTPPRKWLTAVSAFYDALCACASLHPDPQFDEEDTFMSGDWITAESGQFEDADAEDGEEEEGNPTKWRRTE